jgi:hypothetical protein
VGVGASVGVGDGACSARKNPHVINVFLVLVRLRIKVESCRVRDVL